MCTLQDKLWERVSWQFSQTIPKHLQIICWRSQNISVMLLKSVYSYDYMIVGKDSLKHPCQTRKSSTEIWKWKTLQTLTTSMRERSRKVLEYKNQNSIMIYMSKLIHYYWLMYSKASAAIPREIDELDAAYSLSVTR